MSARNERKIKSIEKGPWIYTPWPLHLYELITYPTSDDCNPCIASDSSQ